MTPKLPIPAKAMSAAAAMLLQYCASEELAEPPRTVRQPGSRPLSSTAGRLLRSTKGISREEREIRKAKKKAANQSRKRNKK